MSLIEECGQKHVQNFLNAIHSLTGKTLNYEFPGDVKDDLIDGTLTDDILKALTSETMLSNAYFKNSSQAKNALVNEIQYFGATRDIREYDTLCTIVLSAQERGISTEQLFKTLPSTKEELDTTNSGQNETTRIRIMASIAKGLSADLENYADNYVDTPTTEMKATHKLIELLQQPELSDLIRYDAVYVKLFDMYKHNTRPAEFIYVENKLKDIREEIRQANGLDDFVVDDKGHFIIKYDETIGYQETLDIVDYMSFDYDEDGFYEEMTDEIDLFPLAKSVKELSGIDMDEKFKYTDWISGITEGDFNSEFFNAIVANEHPHASYRKQDICNGIDDALKEYRNRAAQQWGYDIDRSDDDGLRYNHYYDLYPSNAGELFTEMFFDIRKQMDVSIEQFANLLPDKTKEQFMEGIVTYAKGYLDVQDINICDVEIIEAFRPIKYKPEHLDFFVATMANENTREFLLNHLDKQHLDIAKNIFNHKNLPDNYKGDKDTPAVEQDEQNIDDDAR